MPTLEKPPADKDFPSLLIAIVALIASAVSSYQATDAAREATKVTNDAAIYAANAASAAARETARIADDVAESSRLHARLTMRPLFDFRFKIGVGQQSSDAGFLRLDNVGEGAGIVKSAEACFDGKVFTPTASALWENVSSTLVSAREIQTSTLKQNQKISKGGQAKIFNIPAGPIAASFQRDKDRKDAVSRLKIHVLGHSPRLQTLGVSDGQDHA